MTRRSPFLSPFALLPCSLLLLAATEAGEESAKGFVGIRVAAVPAGARVVEVLRGGAAESAGLSEGDIVVSVRESVAKKAESLAGKSVDEMRDLLRGPPGTRVLLTLDPFPPGGGLTERGVERRPAPANAEKPPMEPAPPVLRERNLARAALASNRAPDWERLLSVFEACEDATLREAHLLDLLRDADNLGWSREGPSASTRKAFWADLATLPRAAALLGGLSPEGRLSAVRVLARHRPSVPLARSLLTGLPRDAESKTLRALCDAVEKGSPAAVEALAVRSADVVDAQGWVGDLKPRPSDLAALELALDAGVVSEASPPAGLSPALLRRLELRGFPIPWSPTLERADFGRLEAPSAPALDVPDVGGKRLRLSEHKGPLAVAFWSTTCGPCREELPRLQGLVAPLSETGFDVWAIAGDADPALVRKEAEKLGLHVPVGLADRATLEAWDVGPVPRLFVLDASHRVLLDHQGFNAARFDALAEEIRGVARGGGDGARRLGSLLGEGLDVEAVGLAGQEIRAFAVDRNSGLWAAREEDLSLVRVREGRLLLDESRSIPLPFEVGMLRWADLDGDGAEELLSVPEGGTLLRVSREDGRVLWTDRDAGRILGLGVRLARSAPEIVLLRGRDSGHPIPRLLLFDAGGRRLAELPVPDAVGIDTLATRPDILIHSSTGRLLATEGLEPPVPLAFAPEELRALTWSAPPDRPTRMLMAGRGASALHACGEGALVLSGGGDLLGLDGTGEARFRLDLERPALHALADPDADGDMELVVAAPWFGVASLRPRCADPSRGLDPRPPHPL